MGKKEPKIPVMEIFGPTIQGEGIMTGTFTHFLRTGGCGLRCSWCDSMHAVLPAEVKKHRIMMSVQEIASAIVGLPYAPYVTFTGGDPCLHKRLGDTIPILNHHEIRIAVETQGELFPNWLMDTDVVTFSPKGPSSGNVVDPDDIIQWLIKGQKTYTGRVCIKIVIFNVADLEYALRVYEKVPQVFYDGFYFTAGTLLYNSDKEASVRAMEVVESMQEVANTLLLRVHEGLKVNEKVHIGCQQHVLLWPEKEKGV